MKVTREQILEIMPNAKAKVDAFLPYINGYAETFKIDTPKRMAHFLAQIAHESGELRYTKELGNKNYFRKYRDMSVFAFAAVYLLSVIDAYVDAELSTFDISRDLSLHWQPASLNSDTKLQRRLGYRSYGAMFALSF